MRSPEPPFTAPAVAIAGKVLAGEAFTEPHSDLR